VAGGGFRPGAGRPKGARNKKTVELQRCVEATGKTPLDVMLDAMREAYRKGGATAAAPFAKEAAPYVHAKLSSVTAGNKDDLPFRVDMNVSDARARVLEKLKQIASRMVPSSEEM
jgi:hypothetical protein